MRAVSLFSGAGGMDLGFAEVGFDIVRSIDNDHAAAAVHKFNFDSDALVADITTVDFTRWAQELGDVDVVLGGFPCQGFSKAGTKKQDDPRNKLYRAMRDAVRDLNPSYFVAENVEGLVQNFNGQFLKMIEKDFGVIGYDVEVRLLDAIGFGTPQYRRRIIFVGIRQDYQNLPFVWPLPKNMVKVRNGETKRPKAMSSSLHGLLEGGLFAQREPLNISDAISDLLDLSSDVPDHAILDDWPESYVHVIKAIGPGQKLCNVRHSSESVRTWDIPAAFGEVKANERYVLETIARNRRHKKYGSLPNGNPLPVSVIEELTGLPHLEPLLSHLVESGYLKSKNGGYDLLGGLFCSGLFKRPKWNEPSPTVLTNYWNPRYFIHPIKDRPFSLREVARLQGFPDSFHFTASGISLVDGYRLVGNAVPPPLAKALAESIAKGLRPSLWASA